VAEPGGPLPTWEVHAIRLGSVDRPAQANFLTANPEGVMRLDFVMWLVRSPRGAVVVDTGFSEQEGGRRGRVLERRPAAAVRELGVDPRDVGTVVLTHLHYDHAGNLGDFPEARVVLQEREIDYATGRAMTHPTLSHFFDAEDVSDVVRLVHEGRVQFVNGRHELFPGLEVHLIGGHTRGLQVVRVHTERGWVVLASDALHYYANFALRDPFPAIVDLAEMLDGYETLTRLADSDEHLVPGHDPEVFTRYPNAGLPDGVVALHHPPLRMSSSVGRK
jgi:glyoxylase-like metal-dependent hydrolase (beta-lactamase superfamily II)